MMFGTGNLHQGYFSYGPQLWIVCVSFSVAGGFLGLLLTTSFPEFVDMVEEIPELKNCNVEKKNTALSSLYNLLTSLAECVASLTAGFTTGYFGYVNAYFMVGSFVIIFGLLYFIICGFGKGVEPEQIKNPILYESASENKSDRSTRSENPIKRRGAHNSSYDEQDELLGRKTV